MEFKGSKTEANLHTAFAGESEARNKYTYYAGIAKKEGYNQIASIFEETAGNEKEHAKIWFKILMSGGIPHASLPDTMANLKDAAAGEHYECSDNKIYSVNIMNGPTCMQVLQRKQEKKALIKSLSFLKKLPKSRKSMKKDIWHCSPISKMTEYSNVKKNRFGSAATVAELLLLKKLRKNARSATIRRAILN